MKNNFVAVDFEMSYGHIPCSIGIVEFIDGEVVNKYESLIRPIDLKFSPINPSKNGGIYLEDVINEREFDEIWDEISHFFCNRTIVAHQASTDINVLLKTLNHYKIEIPNFKSFCTLKISQKTFDLDNFGLNKVANHLNIIQENHHNALDDAFVCGQIFNYLCNEIDEDNISRIGQYHTGVSHRNKSAVDNYFNKVKVVKRSNIYSPISEIQTDKLSGKTFVVSGVFEQFSRDELKKAIEDNGGKVGSSISAKTDFVVAGANMGPAKLEKAVQLNIPIISENDFMGMINKN